MSEPINFKFNFKDTTTVVCSSSFSSPIQTVNGTCNWLSVDFDTDQSLSAGIAYHSASLKSDGTLWLWGSGAVGQLGNNSTTDRSSPVQTVTTGTDWKQVALGYTHSAAIKTDGTLWLWGCGSSGRLGNNSNINRSSPVQTVSTGTNWKQVSLGCAHSAAIKTDGTLWLWGCNAIGQLGINSTLLRSSPVQTVTTGNNWNQVSLGRCNSAAIKTDGTLWLWGLASYGVLGDNLTVNVQRSSPIQTVSTGTNWKQISLGAQHSAAIKTDGTLWVWGRNNSGQLGTNSTTNLCSPSQTVTSGANWKQVSLGATHSAAIKTDGTLWLWGNSFTCEMGINSTTYRSSPVQTASCGTNWKQISLGCRRSLASKTDGTLWSWGSSRFGSFGSNNGDNFSTYVLTQTIPPDNQVWIAKEFAEELCVFTGPYAVGSASIKTDGTLWLWGKNDCGKLGDSSTTNRSSPVQTVSTGTNWKQVALGECHSAAIKTDGTLWLWGRALCGTLGNNSTTNQSSPVQTVTTGTNWKQVALGGRSSAATKTDGTLWLWGCNTSGQLGDSSTISQSSPVQTVTTGTDWKQVSLGFSHSAAIKTDGTLWLWGDNINFSPLGDNSSISKSSPVQTVTTGNNWKQVSLGCCFSSAIKTDGTLWLWGYGGFGRLGNNNALVSQSSPVQTVSTGTNWKQVSLGQGHSAAIKTDGTLWMWGCNCNGQLGTNVQGGLVPMSCSPTQTISQTTTWKNVGAGRNHTAATKIDGTLWLWGSAYGGVLGNDYCSGFGISSPVQTISSGSNWTDINECVWCGFDGGFSHSAAIKTDGTLWLWGCNGSGRLGINSTIDQSSPVQTVSSSCDWKQLSLGWYHSAAIKTDGTLWMWGQNRAGLLGNNSTIDQSSPVQTVTTGTNWKQVALGRYHSASIKTDGTLWLWGYNTDGILGDNSTISESSPVQTISTGTNWKQVSLGGGRNSAAIKTDGTLWLWGDSSTGVLGNNCAFDPFGCLVNQSSPVQTVSTLTTWKQVCLGRNHVGAVRTDGRLLMWGCGTFGRLGNNTNSNQSSPVQTISTATNWKQVSLGGCHTTAVKTDGTLWTWGAATCGRLGNNSLLNRSSPVQTISNLSKWRQVAAGERHNLVISNLDVLFAWGDDSSGQVGINCGLPSTTTESCVTYDFDDVFVRKDVFTEGGLWLWGDGSSGQLGDNTGGALSSPSQTISRGSNWKQADSTFLHSAAIKTDGTLWLWGYGNFGVLGNNSTINRSSPVQTVSTGNNWKQVSLGYTHSASIKTDGTLWLWGKGGSSGQLGNNSTICRSSPVQTVSTGTNWKQVSVAGFHSASIKTDGTLWLWGYAAVGQLGNNSNLDQSSPVQTVSTGTNWKQIALGCVHSAAIKTDGTLWLWGCAGSGQLGTNSTTNQSSPAQTVTTGTNWKQVSLGFSHSAAIKTDGTLWLWGDGGSGRLGNNSTTNRSSPVQTVTTGTNWKQVISGCTHSASIKTDGTLWLWGSNANGRLGTNSPTTTNRSSPVQTVSTGTNWKQVSLGSSHSLTIREDCW